VVHGDVVDEFHNNDSLSYSSTAEKSNLSSLGIRGQQVNNLDAGDENLLGLALFGEERSRSVDRSANTTANRTLLIYGLANNVKNAAEGSGADGNHDRSTSVTDSLSTDQALGGFHGNCADGVLSEMLGDLENDTRRSGGNCDFKGVQDWGKRSIELHVDDGTNDLGDVSSEKGLTHRV
jgi:hypothetical protein